MPVRRVSNRGGNIIGKFPSLKMRRMIDFESLIERDYLYLLDYEPAIKWFEEQPVTIEYQDNDQMLHYTPDFHLIEADQNVLVECKPEVFTERAENQRKFQAARRWCAEREWNFRVITDTQLRSGHRLENIKLLTYYARLHIPPHIKGLVYEILTSSRPGTTANDVAQMLPPRARTMALPVIMHMAFHHEVEVPLTTTVLSLSSPVSMPVDARLYPFGG